MFTCRLTDSLMDVHIGYENNEKVWKRKSQIAGKALECRLFYFILSYILCVSVYVYVFAYVCSCACADVCVFVSAYAYVFANE